MRRLIGRWAAIFAVVAGIGVAAASVPAAATPPSSSATSSASAQAGMRSASDWWL